MSRYSVSFSVLKSEFLSLYLLPISCHLFSPLLPSLSHFLSPLSSLLFLIFYILLRLASSFCLHCSFSTSSSYFSLLFFLVFFYSLFKQSLFIAIATCLQLHGNTSLFSTLKKFTQESLVKFFLIVPHEMCICMTIIGQPLISTEKNKKRKLEENTLIKHYLCLGATSRSKHPLPTDIKCIASV